MDVPNMSRNVKKRAPQQRIFVNRSVRLDKIKYFGFDMDYTLAVYVSPEFETLSFRLIMQRLVTLGYPRDLLDFEYDPSFPVRGLWFDTQYGTLLKVDPHGNILRCSKGFYFMKPSEINELYPNRFITLEHSRIFVLNTLFNLPETYVYACIVQLFVTNPELTITPEGVFQNDLFMSYKSIFTDVRGSVDFVNMEGDMKQLTIDNLDKYVVRDPAIPTLLQRLRDHGKKTFLLTNSGYYYTDKLMKYLLEFDSPPFDQEWKSYFDLIIVDARKPLFFSEGTILRQVDTDTGALHIGRYVGPMKKGQVYSGGSITSVSELFQTSGSDVLYFGDHIYGDVLKSKKLRGWKTFLVVPELAQEIDIWVCERALFEKLESLNADLFDCYINLDSARDLDSAVEIDRSRHLKNQIRDVSHQVETLYGKFGSLFRSGSQQTFFAGQTLRYADLYAASFINLVHYPFSYIFKAPMQYMPHEQTVRHGDVPHLPISTHGGEKTLSPVVEDVSPLVARQQNFDHLIGRSGSPDSANAIGPPSFGSGGHSSDNHPGSGSGQKMTVRRNTLQSVVTSLQAPEPNKRTTVSHENDDSSSDTEDLE